MLGWSIRLFRIRGIRLSVHFTFLLLLGYVGWEGWHERKQWLDVVISTATLLVVFVFVILHELGHSFMARRFGVRVSRILLLPIGGMAEFDSIPRQPKSEILIALAGPAVNFVLIGVFLLFVPFPNWNELLEAPLTPTTAAQLILLLNTFMGLFNLLPVFPMDGGRVFRALLARRLSYSRATFWAATLGKILAVVAGATALFYFQRPHYTTAMLFAFIFIAGEIEYRAVKRQDADTLRWREINARFASRPTERRQVVDV
jgi:Zn-dependent protease